MSNTNTTNTKTSNSISDLLTKSVNTRTYNILIEKEVGTKCAIMLNQIQYWINIYSDDDHFYDGQYWIHETYQEWKEQFPEWGFSTIRRVLEKLEDRKLIKVGNFNKMKNDHTKWYTINEKVVKKVLENISPVQNEQADCSKWTSMAAQNEQAGLSKMNKALPNISTNNSTNISTKTSKQGFKITDYAEMNSLNQDTREGIRRFAFEYKFIRGEEHPLPSDEDMRDIANIIDRCLTYVTMDDFKKAIRNYFDTKFGEGCDYRIKHFLSPGVLRNRLYELGYGKATVDDIVG